MPTNEIASAVAALSLVLTGTWAGTIHGQAPSQEMRQPTIESTPGRALYEFHCASCHGRDGKGNGPVAPSLKSQPPDLTRLAQRNDGVFPRARIEAIVEGRSDPPLVAHGSREMPVWGPAFRDLDPDEAANRTRIASIVGYLQSLQVRYASLSQPDRRRTSTRQPRD